MAKRFNVEIKARTDRPARACAVLTGERAESVGRIRQVDTYFHCRDGRLKLRESPLGDQLVCYQRADQTGPKDSDIMLEALPDGHGMRALLARALGVLVVVDKQRQIYRIDNVQFHVDEVEGLGEFLEIEAIDDAGGIGKARLLEQCEHYMKVLGIDDADLVSRSYSDLALDGQANPRDAAGGAAPAAVGSL